MNQIMFDVPNPLVVRVLFLTHFMLSFFASLILGFLSATDPVMSVLIPPGLLSSSTCALEHIPRTPRMPPRAPLRTIWRRPSTAANAKMMTPSIFDAVSRSWHVPRLIFVQCCLHWN